MNKDELKGHIESFISETDQFLVDIKLSPSKLAVYIDKPTGIQLNECSALNKHLSGLLEPSGFLETHELEVSSPGMDMPLMVRQQYVKRTGSEVKVVTTGGQEAKGILKAADEDGFELLVISEKKEKKVKIRNESVEKYLYSNVRETKLVLNFKFK